MIKISWEDVNKEIEVDCGNGVSFIGHIHFIKQEPNTPPSKFQLGQFGDININIQVH